MKAIKGLLISLLCLIPLFAHSVVFRISEDEFGGDMLEPVQSFTASADGQFIVFATDANNLVPNDTNGVTDIFIKNTVTNSITRVSESPLGIEGDGASWNPLISTDGRYVVFESHAANLIINDTNAQQDIFVKDMILNTIERVSESTGGDEITGNIYNVQITPDGRYVVFASNAAILVANDTNGQDDIFVRDLQNRTTVRASLSDSGDEVIGYIDMPQISADGRYVVFVSDATDLVQGDTNFVTDVFVRDMLLSTTTRVSLSSSGAQANNYSYEPKISADGRFVVFTSDATNLVPNDTNWTRDVFLRDIQEGITTRVNVATNGDQITYATQNHIISQDGRYVLFESDADNLVANDGNWATDVFIRDTLLNTTTIVSSTQNGVGDGTSMNATFTPDGRYVVFSSIASNFVANDGNGTYDIFIKDMTVPQQIIKLSNAVSGTDADNQSYQPVLTRSGSHVLFFSDATNLIIQDLNSITDLFATVLVFPPSIVFPTSTPINASGTITIYGQGVANSNIRLSFMSQLYTTIVQVDGTWSIQLPGQPDGGYTLYYAQKSLTSSAWSTTGQIQFSIDTIAPSAPIITSPLSQALISTTTSVTGFGEPGAFIEVIVGSETITGVVGGGGQWDVGPFTVLQGYYYPIQARQTDAAGNRGPRSEIVGVYGVDIHQTSVSSGLYTPDTFVTLRGITQSGNSITTRPGHRITYMTDFANIGNAFATGVVVEWVVPQNTCFVLGSLSGMVNDYIIQYDNTTGGIFNYTPLGLSGGVDCAIRAIRATKTTPLMFTTAVKIDNLQGTGQNTTIYTMSGVNTLTIDTLQFNPMMMTGGNYTFHHGEGFTSDTVVDIEDDGDIDVIGYGHMGNPTYIFYNDGSANFTPVEIPGGNNRYVGGKVVDFNGDNIKDFVAFALEDNYVSFVYIADGLGGFVASPLPGGHYQSHQGAVADVDSDGDIDIIQFGHNNRNTVLFLNNGSGGFTDQILPGGTTFFVGGRAEDIDDDGDVDLVGWGWNNTSSKIYRNNGLGGFTDENLPGGTTRFLGGTIVDIDNDGDKDLIGFGYGMNTILYRNDGVSYIPVPIGGTFNFVGGAVGDFDQNGYIDLVGFGGYGSAGSYIYWNNGGSFTTMTLPGPIANFVGGLTTDFDGDGDIDIVGLGFGNGFNTEPTIIYTNQGDRNFSQSSVQGGQQSFLGGGISDFDNDGKVDFVAMGMVNKPTIAFMGLRVLTGSYTTILKGNQNAGDWSHIVLQEQVQSGSSLIEYAIFPVQSGNTCDISSPLVGPLGTSGGVIILSGLSISAYPSLCIQATMGLVPGVQPPRLINILAFQDVTTVQQFSFSVQVAQPYMGNQVLQTVSIQASATDKDSNNNTAQYVFNVLQPLNPLGGGGNGGSIGGGFAGGLTGNAGGVLPQLPLIGSSPTSIPSMRVVRSLQETAEVMQRIQVQVRQPDPVVVSSSVLSVAPTSFESALEQGQQAAIGLSVGSTLSLSFKENPLLGGHNSCSSPRNPVTISVGKSVLADDVALYQGFLFAYGITRFDQTDLFRPSSLLTRQEAAKILSDIARYILCRSKKTTYHEGLYTDIANVDPTLVGAIKEAYEYGILRGSSGQFRPRDILSKKEFVAAVVRLFTNQNLDVYGVGNDWDREYRRLFESWVNDTVLSDRGGAINRYEVAKIIYLLYYLDTFSLTQDGHTLPVQ